MYEINVFHWPMFADNYEEVKPIAHTPYCRLKFSDMHKAIVMLETLADFQVHMLELKKFKNVDIEVKKYYDNPRPYLNVVGHMNDKEYILSRYEAYAIK